MNAMMFGLTHHDHDSWKRINESAASVERVASSDEVRSRTSIDESLTDDLLGTTNIKKALGSGDATDPHGDAQ